jgi:6-phospho-beta-glucosidase
MKVTVIGGGSTYTPELVNGFLSRLASFPLNELWLMDIDPKRLQIVGEFAQRMVKAKGSPFEVFLTTNQRQAVDASAYVITQLRVGMMPARRCDEYLGRNHNLIGQETTGIGGMAKALRTIPVILDIAREIQESAPQALLVNFTNPAGLVTEALFRYAPSVSSVGVCNAAITTKMHILDDLVDLKGETIDPQRAQLATLGLNHLTWHSGFKLDGEELWSRVFSTWLDHERKDPNSDWDLTMFENLGMMPNYYLSYFYNTHHKLKEQKKWPPSRAEQVMEIEKDLLHMYADPRLTEPPADLMKRGGAYYSTLATELLNSHYNDLGEVHVVNTQNSGAVKNWPDDWVIEIPSRVDKLGIHPLEADPLPPVCNDLVSQVKKYELLTVEAAVHGNKDAAFQAMVSHPLGPKSNKANAVLEDLLATNKAYLPQFFI